MIVLHLLLRRLEGHTVKDEGPSLLLRVGGPLMVDSVFVSEQFQLLFLNLN